jgi:hypothetical protein
MAEAHPASAPLGGQGGVSANADVFTYPRHLLAYARTLIDQSHYGMAVIVSHMACEIATERRLSEAIVVKGVEYLRSQLLRRNAGYSLYNERLRCLYTTLTGDNIQKEPFWPKFKESSKRRNRIVHVGAGVDVGEAEESHTAAGAFVAHLKF